MTQVLGSVHPDFAEVAEAFARNFSERGELGAALHVTVGGSPVVDLWAGVADPATGAAWEADTLTCSYSCTKGVVALAAHLLVARGELDLEAPVARYWPEYADQGKSGTTVRMLLDHSAGVPALDAALRPGDMYDADVMADHLARQRPWWQPGTRHGYHLVTFGWTVGEVVRRVSGLTIGQFVARELAGPVGADFFLGLPAEHEARVAPSREWVPGQGWVPTPYVATMLADPTSVQAVAVANVLAAQVDANCRDFRAAEMGGMGGFASARGLATLYGPGVLGGLLDADTVTRMSQPATASSQDALLLIPTRFALGFMVSTDNRRRAAGSEGNSVVLGPTAFGHVGKGGSIGFADPAEGLAFGYVMNQHGEGILLNAKGQGLVDATYRALGRRTDAPGVWVR